MILVFHLCISLVHYRRVLIGLIATSKRKPGTVAAAVIEEKRTALSRKIARWRLLQAVYMPVVAADLLGVNVSSETPELQDLQLPSALAVAMRAQLLTEHDLLRKEFRLRIAQADDALDALRRVLALRNAVYGYKQVNLVGQRDGTRAHTLLSRLNDKRVACASRYRAVRSALVALNFDGPWKDRLKPLLESDIKGPTGDDDDGTALPNRSVLGEGTRTLSWIWKVSTGDVPSAGNVF